MLAELCEAQDKSGRMWRLKHFEESEEIFKVSQGLEPENLWVKIQERCEHYAKEKYYEHEKQEIF